MIFGIYSSTLHGGLCCKICPCGNGILVVIPLGNDITHTDCEMCGNHYLAYGTTPGLQAVINFTEAHTP